MVAGIPVGGGGGLYRKMSKVLRALFLVLASRVSCVRTTVIRKINTRIRRWKMKTTMHYYVTGWMQQAFLFSIRQSGGTSGVAAGRNCCAGTGAYVGAYVRAWWVRTSGIFPHKKQKMGSSQLLVKII